MLFYNKEVALRRFSYYRCRICKKVYITEAACRKHNEEIHRNITRTERNRHVGRSDSDDSDDDDDDAPDPEPRSPNSENNDTHTHVAAHTHTPTNASSSGSTTEEKDSESEEHNEVGYVEIGRIGIPPRREERKRASEDRDHAEALLQLSESANSAFTDFNEEKDCANQACTNGENSVDVEQDSSLSSYEVYVEVNQNVTDENRSCDASDQEAEETEAIPSVASEIEIDVPVSTEETGTSGDDECRSNGSVNAQDPLDIDEAHISENEVNEPTSFFQSTQSMFQISPNVIEATSRVIVIQGGHVSEVPPGVDVQELDQRDVRPTVNNRTSIPVPAVPTFSSQNSTYGPDNWSADMNLAVVNQIKFNNSVLEAANLLHKNESSNTASFDHLLNRRRHNEARIPSPTDSTDEPANKRGRSSSIDALVIVARENNYTAGFLGDGSIRPKQGADTAASSSSSSNPSCSLREIATPNLVEKTTTESTPDSETSNDCSGATSSGPSNGPESQIADVPGPSIQITYDDPPGNIANSINDGNVPENAEATSSSSVASPVKNASAEAEDVELEIIKVIPPRQKKKVFSSWITKRKKRSFGNAGQQRKKCSFCALMVDHEDPTVRKSVKIGRTEVPLSCSICKDKYGEYRILITRRLGDIKYGCSECTKDFNTKTALISHFHVHTGEKRVVVKREPQPEAQKGENNFDPPDIFAVKPEQEHGVEMQAPGHNQTRAQKKRRGLKASND